MEFDQIIASASVFEATRPKRSGVMQNAHNVKPKLEPKTDYEQMRRQVQGDSRTSQTSSPEKTRKAG